VIDYKGLFLLKLICIFI